MVKFLTASEEATLAKAWRDHGDERAMHHLVLTHVPLARKLASRYFAFPVDREDLFAVAQMGLIKAASAFDPDRGVRFSTCAAFWVRNELQDHVMRFSSIVSRPRDSRQKRKYLTSARLAHDVPLDASVVDDGDTRSAMLEDPSVDLEDGAALQMDAARLRRIIGRLPPREEEIVRARHLRPEPLTLQDLANCYGLSKERVRQLEQRAVDTLTHMFHEEVLS